MKLKVLISFLIVAWVVNLLSLTPFAAYKDIPSNANYKLDVERLNKLGILVYKDNFKPNQPITRAELAQALVKISNAEDDAISQKKYTLFSDIKPNTNLCGFVTWAVSKKYLTPMADGNFHPGEPATFSQVVTALVRVLGYSDTDIGGVWPQNYIDKAKQLGLCEGLNFSADSKVSRWAFAKMLSYLLDTQPKGSTAKFHEAVGLYSSILVLDTSKTSSKLLSGEVLTDSGVLVNTTKTSLDSGIKYMVKVQDGKITKVFGQETDSYQVAITKVNGKTVYFSEGGKKKSINLPASATYFISGAKQSYDAIENVLKPNQKISFVYSFDRNKIEYVVINDLYLQNIYGNYDEVLILANSNTTSSLSTNQIQTDKGIFYLASGIKPNSIQIGTKYGVYIKDDTITKVAQKIWDVKKYTIKSIDSNVIEVDQNGKSQSMTLLSKPAYYYQGIKRSYDSISNILKEDQILYVSKDIDAGKVMAYIIQDPYSTKYGTYSEVIVLQDALLNSALENNQVLTDKGIYNLADTNTKLEIGSKYAVYIKDDRITLVVKKLNSTDVYEVTDVVSSTNVKLKSQKGQENVIMPQKPVYYYNGSKINYSNLKSVLKSGQKVYFGYSKDGKTCEYIAIQDPYLSDYGTYTEVVVLANAVVSDKLSSNEVLTDKGIYAIKPAAGKLTVGAKYGVYINGDTITKVVKKLNSVDIAEISQVIGDTNVTLKKGNTTTTTSLPQKPVYYYNGNKVDYSNLKNVIKAGQKIYFGYNAAGNSYEYAIIQDPYYDSYGKYIETVVLGTYSTTKGLDVNEILTDQGILTLPENQSTNLELGAKYGLYIDQDNQITLVFKRLNSTDDMTVVSAISNKVTVDKGGTQVDMILPQNITYYYNGSKIDYSTALSKIQMLSSLVFGISTKKKGYDYCVVFDPVYSKPYIAGDQTYQTLKVGDLDISGSRKFIKDGDVVDYSYIQKYNVVYEVKDIWGRNSYILIVDNKVECYLKSFVPTRFTPKSIVVSVYDSATEKLVEKTYEISENCDSSWILSDTFKTSQRVYLLLGYDGKVVAISKP
ncbi:S-layer domain-containing protein [Caldicellulosiruptor kronotskyensis 2002]|uniref:S-layer domain-containing protein n=1 Tax=Caldicellulosiruptor kronotskyensis (strain DSM 18902 / VKM B-2412 / 2002) TaxID=632348 RepID=E4SD46_CALK2|nr:S-layer homology domain-containing protein [Caldicellulosiruptor kronotskyensis]ADQ45110.1 S-layer domain-containing protein [Caldicellulosiruptor kronotskyensis 2002]